LKKKPSTKKPGIQSEKLEKALVYIVHDLLDRAVLEPMLGGQTLKSIQEGELKGSKLELIVLSKHYRALKRLLEAWQQNLGRSDPDFSLEDEDGFLRWKHDGIPVEIQIVKRKYECFQRPDFVIYKYEFYKIPNPWKGYWKIRGIIK